MCCSRKEVDELRSTSVGAVEPVAIVEGEAAGVAVEIDRLLSNVDIVDRQLGPLAAAAFDETDRDIGGDGSLVSVGMTFDVLEGSPKPSAEEKNEDFWAGGSDTGGVVTGSGRSAERSAGGGIGDRW